MSCICIETIETKKKGWLIESPFFLGLKQELVRSFSSQLSFSNLLRMRFTFWALASSSGAKAT